MAESIAFTMLIASIMTDGREKLAFLCFCVMCSGLVFTDYWFYLDGLHYYLANGALCFVGAILSTRIEPAKNIHFDIALMWCLLIAVHAISYLLYELYFEPIWYQMAYFLIGLAMIARLLHRGRRDGCRDSNTTFDRLVSLCASALQRNSGLSKG